MIQRSKTVGAVLLFVASQISISSPYFGICTAYASSPVISNIQVKNITTTGGSVTWTTDVASNSWVNYGLTAQYGLAASLYYVYGTSHLLNLSGLKPNTMYHYQVKSKNSAGLTTISTDQTFTTLPVATTGLACTDWTTIYNGYGSVTCDSSNGIVMEPEQSTSISVTHAALALSNQYLSQPVTNFVATLVVSTEQQLRVPTPNSWEVFWFFFNYTSDSMTSDGNKMTNYFTFKTNGVELGKAYASIGQTYLSTLTTPMNKIGQIYTLTINKLGQHLTVLIDGVKVVDFTGTTEPNMLVDGPGTFGIYTEDARVHVYSVVVTPQ